MMYPIVLPPLILNNVGRAFKGSRSSKIFGGCAECSKSIKFCTSLLKLEKDIRLSLPESNSEEVLMLSTELCLFEGNEKGSV